MPKVSANVYHVNEDGIYTISASVKSAGFNKKDGEVVGCYVAFTTESDLSEVLEDCFKGAKAQYIPKWYKDNRETITAKSAYKVPVLLNYGEYNKERVSFEEWTSMGVKDSSAILKLKIGDGAVYINAVVVMSEGEDFDPFADMI